MKKIFTLLILLLLLPVTALAADEHDSHSNNWTEFTAGTTTLSGGSYYLSGDVAYTGTQSITVSGEVTLCLNGHKLDLNKQHISVGSGASLTLCDCSTGGVLTGGSGSNGGGVYVDGGGTFTMTGGNITGNTANTGGGVYVYKGGTFTMEDGSIKNNQATVGGGGGVHVHEGTFTLSGGSITGNTTNSDTFGYGGGVCLYGTFYLSGDAIIQNNTKAGATDNLYLGWNTIKITGPLGENARIGVTAEGVPRSFISGWSDNMAGENPADYFSSDGDALGIGLNADGNVVLGSLCTTITLNTNDGILPEYSLVEGAALPIPTKTGYTFAGWYEKEDLSGDPVTEIPSYAVGDKQYWAKWTANTYTVTFEANGGTGSMDDQTFTYGEEKALTENTFTRTGYTFAGWNTQADGNGTSYADGVDGSQMPADNGSTVILYAQWTINTYKITAQVANGCEGMGEVIGGGTYKYGTTVTLTATANSGYRFVGWEDGETSATRKITVEGNATYTAKFEQYYPVTNITLDKTELSLSIGDSETLTATIEPNNATNKNVTWSSNNEAVATVDNGKVTAVKEGTTTITVTTEDGGKKATCTVTVTHSMVHTPKKDATCTEDGNIEYWYCKNCDKYFSDENATEELSDVVIPATGHHYVNGYCTKCGHRDPDYRPDPISYYNIYIEDVCDGVEVTLSNNVVREGNSISVYVKKDTVNYTFDNFKVYYKRSYYGTWDELKESTQPGEYPIKNIWTHIYIKAEGAEEKEDPTGIESIEGVKVYTKDGSLYVQTPQREQVIIVSMSGAVVKNEEQVGLKQYHGLQPGIYIVRVGDKAYKLRLN